MNADLVAAQLEEFRAALTEINANVRLLPLSPCHSPPRASLADPRRRPRKRQLDAATEAFERAKATYDAECADFTTTHTQAVREAARVVDKKWATARRENLAGYADLTGSLEGTKDAFARVARATANGVLERDEDVRALGDAFRSFENVARKELAFAEKAAAWPEAATRDFLADVDEDKRVVAVRSLERIDEAHRASRRARREAFREKLGALAVDIDRAREADGERIRVARERAAVWDERLSIEPGLGDDRTPPLRSAGGLGVAP